MESLKTLIIANKNMIIMCKNPQTLVHKMIIWAALFIKIKFKEKKEGNQTEYSKKIQ